MEWLYIVGLIAYYLYKAYNNGVKKQQKQPIKKVEQRQPEKTIDEILKELVDNAQKKKEVKKPITTPQQQKQVQKSNPKPIVSTKTKDKTYDTLLHKHKDLNSSVEYDDNIENILHHNYDSVDKVSSDYIAESTLEMVKHEIGEISTNSRKKLAKLYIKGKIYTPKDLLIANTIFERKFE